MYWGGIRVAWDKVCLPKKGGLGLKRVEDWNRAAILKHIWSLFTQSGSLWVAWIHRHLIKDKCSWTCEVGDGRKIFLWHDHWHPDGILYLKYGHRVMYDAASRSDARAGQINLKINSSILSREM
uniref:Reverse transcriptase zinc-binding domain-containing protein n=1 Tax=Fagus sylvatica TaxID=28930 RepID=A0A2N9IIX2_FAGSY